MTSSYTELNAMFKKAILSVNPKPEFTDEIYSFSMALRELWDKWEKANDKLSRPRAPSIAPLKLICEDE
jgi:hypothetical protein